MNGNRISVAAVTVLMLAGGLYFGAAGPASAAAVRETIDGVVHVRNGATPSAGVETVEIEEEWRVGGEDSDVFFGLIPRVCADRQGNVHVLDSQLNQVLVFSPDGEQLRTLFRQGDGPGEIRGPRDMMVFGDGRVGLVQEFPGVVVFVDSEGDPAGRLKVGGASGGMFILSGCDAAGDNFALSGGELSQSGRPGVQDRTYFLGAFDERGAEIRRYAESRAVYDFNDFKFSEREHVPVFWWCFAVGEDGRTCVAPDRDAYAIRVFDPDGRLAMIISRDYKPIDLGDQEYAEMRRIFESALTGLPDSYELVTERRAPAIAHMQRGLRMRADGSIWAMSGRGIRDLPSGVLVVFDVFDRDGGFVKQVEIRGPGNALKDGIFFAGEDRIIVVKGYMESLAAQFGSGTTASGSEDGEESYLAVISYAIAR